MRACFTQVYAPKMLPVHQEVEKMKEETKALKALAEQALKLVDWAKHSANENFVQCFQSLTGQRGRGVSKL